MIKAKGTLGLALGRLIEAEDLAARVEVRPTEGSGENMELLASGAAQLAIVQSDSPLVDSVCLIATLFDEALHILVSLDLASRVSQIGDLDGRRVSLGGTTSGTRQVASRILGHFEVVPAEQMVNGIGYRFLGEEDFDKAIAVFRYNIGLYPKSANVYDSLGEAFENAGKLDEALANYSRATDNAAANGDDRLDLFAANRDRVKAQIEEAKKK